MKINVYGASGFVGSNFCNLYKEDVIEQPREINAPKADNVLYLISTTDNYNVFTDLHKDVNVNLTKLMSVLTECKDKDVTFNFVSSWFVYGKVELPAKENSLCNPTGFYSITKKCAEDLIISYCKTFNKKYRILRLCNVYGSNDKGTSKKKNALQYLVGELKANRPINLYNSGKFFRDYMHVTDVCEAIKLVIDKAPVNDIYNIGSGEPTWFKCLIDHVVNETNSTSTITNIDPPEFHNTVQASSIYLDVTKIRNLGFVPKLDIYKEILK